jgi:hypothetical protein
MFKTRITEMFGIEYSIIQGAMLMVGLIHDIPSVKELIDGIINEGRLICRRLYKMRVPVQEDRNGKTARNVYLSPRRKL